MQDNGISQNDWLEKLPLSDPFWLQLLVDDELTPEQRRAYLEFLRKDPSRWRKCAEAFLDEQVMRRGVRQASLKGPAPSESNAVRPRVSSARAARQRWTLLLTAAVCLIAGAWARPADRAGGVALAPVPARSVTPGALYELSDSIHEAEYAVSGRAPRLVLDALIFAGHSIAVEQRSVRPDLPPLNVLRVRKFGQLLAESDSARRTGDALTP